MKIAMTKFGQRQCQNFKNNHNDKIDNDMAKKKKTHYYPK